MRRAGEITARAHLRAIQHCRPGLYEYQLEAELQHEFARSGARHPAYPSIVGSGPNACVLHYLDNSARMRDGDLVLVDAGCEFQYYAADVTRTYPVGGRFDEPRRTVYEIVLRSQEAALSVANPGATLDAVHDAAAHAAAGHLLQDRAAGEEVRVEGFAELGE